MKAALTRIRDLAALAYAHDPSKSLKSIHAIATEALAVESAEEKLVLPVRDPMPPIERSRRSME